MLTEFDLKTRDILNDIIVLRYVPHLKLDYLELAVDCHCQKYVSELPVQNVLDDLWTGKKNNEIELVKKNYFYCDGPI